VVGRKRHIVVDTLGLLWALVVTAANVQDRDGGRRVLKELGRHVKFPKMIGADQAYQAFVSWASVLWLWCVELVMRPRGKFVLQTHRWALERTFGRLNRLRRLAKSFERTTESQAALITIAMIHLMACRLR
jgi:putative transposase